MLRDFKQPCFAGDTIRGLNYRPFLYYAFWAQLGHSQRKRRHHWYEGVQIPCAARRWSARVAMSCSCFLCSSLRPCVKAWYHTGLRFWIAAAERKALIRKFYNSNLIHSLPFFNQSNILLWLHNSRHLNISTAPDLFPTTVNSFKHLPLLWKVYWWHLLSKQRNGSSTYWKACWEVLNRF